MKMIPSGPEWCKKFPTSADVRDLSSAFGPKWAAFEACLKAGGASVSVTATRRPQARAYLMHWSWMVAKGRCKPEDVPPHEGVDIKWDHADAVEAAKDMVETYGISPTLPYPPSLDSNHIRGDAIDCEIHWKGTHLFLKDAHGNQVSVDGEPGCMNHKLWEVGAGFGVIKLKTDKPHWSLNGH
jgi:hypothetical protein